MSFRETMHSYLHLLTGFAGRVVLQALYFYILANTLSLADYGVFASCVAACLVLASGGSFGFSAPLFRAAITRRRVLGTYLGCFYVYALAGLPLTFGIALLVHAFLLKAYIGLPAFLAIVVSECICWRLIEAISSLNAGLGRYARGSTASVLGAALRTLAALGLGLAERPDLETWTFYYLLANVTAAVVCVAFFQPKLRLSWSAGVFFGRLPEAFSFVTANVLQALQSEADKLLILFLAGEAAAGLYAVSMRVIELASVPMKSFLALYVQSLMRRPSGARSWMSEARIEAAIALAAIVLFLVLIAALSMRPGLIGANVAEAYGWFAGLVLVGPAKILIEYHRTLFFAANRIFDFAKISLALFAVKAPAIVAIAILLPAQAGWTTALNVLFAVLYGVSAILTRMLFSRGSERRQRRGGAAARIWLRLSKATCRKAECVVRPGRDERRIRDPAAATVRSKVASMPTRSVDRPSSVAT